MGNVWNFSNEAYSAIVDMRFEKGRGRVVGKIVSIADYERLGERCAAVK